MALVIVGGGIIGLSVAYYVSQTEPGRRIVLIDSERELFLSASGFSGGYIVRDWFSPNVLPLSELSYTLHRDLARRHGGKERWGYTESTAFSISVEQKASDGASSGKVMRGEDWLLFGTSRAEVAKLHARGPVVSDTEPRQTDPQLMDSGFPKWANLPDRSQFEKISSEQGCAQVEPKELCEWLLAQCKAAGVEVLLSTNATELWLDGSGSVIGIKLMREKGSVALECKDIVLAAGCWTPRVFKTLLHREMTPTVTPLPGYSIVVHSPRYQRPIQLLGADGTTKDMSHAIFCPPTSSWTYSPECMARLTRSGRPEIYVAGLNDESIKLPDYAGQSKQLMTQAARDNLFATAVALTGLASNGSVTKNDIEVVREGLCFRPVSTSGIPIIGKVGDVHFKDGGGLYLATGHGPWGITLSLGTGLVVSELLQGKHPSAELSGLSPVQTPAQLRARL